MLERFVIDSSVSPAMTAAIDADRWSSSGWSRSFVSFCHCLRSASIRLVSGPITVSSSSPSLRVAYPFPGVGALTSVLNPEAAIDPDPGRFRCGVEIVALRDVLDDEPELGVVLQRVRHGCLHLRRRREPFHLVS